MHASVCSNHPISPLIILQSSNLSLYSMFYVATLRDHDHTRQAMCMLHTK